MNLPPPRMGYTQWRALWITAALFSLLTARAAEQPHSNPTTEARALAQREAEARKAIAEADRAELLASLPPSSIKPLPGKVDATHIGAAGLVSAFDLAVELAGKVCAALPSDRKTAVYSAAATQGLVAARTVSDGINRLTDELTRQNKQLQGYIEAHTPPGAKTLSPLVVAPTVIPATVRAGADLASLFKTDLTATGIAYGDGARELFASALAQQCPDRIAGLGTGYFGELDAAQHERLLARVQALAAQRGELANRIAILLRLADASKGDEKKDMTAVANAATAQLKDVDSFVELLKAGEASERSPLFTATRYLAYENRVRGAMLLDFDLRLEGLSIVKDGLFSGQRLRLSGVAFLWHRLYQPDGTLVLSKALRRISRPVEVDLRGTIANRDFWDNGSMGEHK